MLSVSTITLFSQFLLFWVEHFLLSAVGNQTIRRTIDINPPTKTQYSNNGFFLALSSPFLTEQADMADMAQGWFTAAQVVTSMLAVQLIGTGMQLLSKVILTNGTFVFALMTYRHVVAALCMAPFAFFFERGATTKLSWLVFFWLFVSSSTGILLAMGLFYYGIKDTTATYSANFLNLIPIVTFFLSIVLRIEKLGLSTRMGKIKTLGAILSVAAALTMSLYKGKSFHLIHKNLGHHVLHHQNEANSNHHWTRGSLMLVGSCVFYASWYIVQVKLAKIFPLRYWATMLSCIIASIESAVVGFCIDRSKGAWSLGWNLELVAIVYSGALATAATFCLLTWAVSKRGPTYPAMFNPLTLIFVAISESLLLGAEITVGTIIGTVMIIVGLYCFLLGKEKEGKVLPQPKTDDVVAVATVAQSPSAVQLVIKPTATASSNDSYIDLEIGSHNNNSVKSRGEET
ncbi:hypothetical protein Tsubulata_015311 [Turnera subulata]|uniref:EamA domain-containing protein n=1 Tax=Turnera subulata TaxID=218843 RepID=A0A9Q0FQ15_9ROSI|nr:hypothetical protein Tsubulata_015311 [Turnera subulata]